MMNGEFYGIIGGKGLKPTKTIQKKERNGKIVKVPFMRFTMFCEDMTKKMELNPYTNKLQRPKKQVQVILPENTRGEKLFNYLEPGRHVFVKGRTTNDPKVKDGMPYVNEKCYMGELTFLDSPRDKQMARALRDMVTAEVINEEVSKKYLAAMIEFYEGKKAGRDEPRLIIDETEQTQLTFNNEDPDQTDFAK